MGDERAIEPLIAALNDKEYLVRKFAGDSCEKIKNRLNDNSNYQDLHLKNNNSVKKLNNDLKINNPLKLLKKLR